MWSAERALSSLITNVIINKKFEQFQVFQDEINNKYAHFLDILKDPVCGKYIPISKIYLILIYYYL